MEHLLVPYQTVSLTHTIHYQPDDARMAQELERIELLVPEISLNTGKNLQAYALAFVEHYQRDVLQLELAWEFLYAALIQAEQQSEDAIVVRLVTSLAYVVGRLSNSGVAEHILHLGIEACQHLQDRKHLACFLNRLGGLLFSHGKYHQGRETWHASLQTALSAGSPLELWEPFSSFAHMADILGCYPAARQFVETLLQMHQVEDSDSFVVAIFIRGFYARLMNDLDGAYEDLQCCLQLLSRRVDSSPPLASYQLFMLVVQAELARVQGNYVRSQEYTEMALSVAQIFSDYYTVAILLMDQGLFTYRQGQFADTLTTISRLRDVAGKLEAPHPYECSRALERYLASQLPTSESTRLISPGTNSGLHEMLSEREMEVLHLVAEGLSNNEIARRLVITTGTVKKHLEHIYIKLDVHSRTAAIASVRNLGTHSSILPPLKNSSFGE